MKTGLRPFLNPLNYWRAYRYSREQRQYDRSAFDLELWLYSKILRNDMLHYGYFEEVSIPAEQISIAAVEAAQMKYAELIAGKVKRRNAPLLDAGCGMGGLTGLLLSSGCNACALTPNQHQIAHVRAKYPTIATYHCKYEELETPERFGTVIHSESLQYIPLDKAFEKTSEILLPDGQWIITDYFRTDRSAHASGHLLTEFREAVAHYGFTVIEEMDITANVLPTLQLVHLYATRFLLPLRHFGYEKLRFKRPFWYYMTQGQRAKVDAKIDREIGAIDPEKFSEGKRYMLFVLEKR